ncbi:late competence development ComFB family protein [Cohnella sp. WQ 127256]|uniref:late competence development ComFB family protein n=1 Tax=Cohnella sp. WQ 127256 TaxID=2938790 RepID=UPI00211890F5|nr:late competence development ComFB family protein [Cohnella sp. WQ 127256]
MFFSRDLSIFNVMEPIVSNIFEDNYVKTGILKCDCQKCQLDIILLALNHVPPHYTSSQAGEAYIKALYMEPQLQSDVLRELTKAAQIIEENPNH